VEQRPGWSQAAGGEGAAHDQLPEACTAIPDIEGAAEGTGPCDGASISPEAIEGGEGVTGVAGDEQLVALLGGEEAVGVVAEAEGAGSGTVEPVETRQIAEISLAQGEAVIARAGEIKGLD